eukprot:m.466767 g.466767  ORF g.466767 m.466767 type:complete len:718 (+) comp25532_c0_seq1:3-2156(+)
MNQGGRGRGRGGRGRGGRSRGRGGHLIASPPPSADLVTNVPPQSVAAIADPVADHPAATAAGGGGSRGQGASGNQGRTRTRNPPRRPAGGSLAVGGGGGQQALAGTDGALAAAARELAAFVERSGGDIPATSMSTFYTAYPHHKKICQSIAGKPKALCRKYPELLVWVPDPTGGNGACIAAATSEQAADAAVPEFSEWEGRPETLKFYHGTSWAAAEAIQRNGFIASEAGCLGEGIYVARKDKALRFAQNGERHGGTHGGLIQLLVTIRNPKFITGEDRGGRWRVEGHDACRTEQTSISPNMEWCIRDRAQVRVIRIYKVPANGGAAGGGGEGEPLQVRAFTRTWMMERYSHLLSQKKLQAQLTLATPRATTTRTVVIGRRFALVHVGKQGALRFRQWDQPSRTWGPMEVPLKEIVAINEANYSETWDAAIAANAQDEAAMFQLAKHLRDLELAANGHTVSLPPYAPPPADIAGTVPPDTAGPPPGQHHRSVANMFGTLAIDGDTDDDDDGDGAGGGGDDQHGQHGDPGNQPRVAPAFNTSRDTAHGSPEQQLRYLVPLVVAGVGEALRCNAANLDNEEFRAKADLLEAAYASVQQAVLQCDEWHALLLSPDGLRDKHDRPLLEQLLDALDLMGESFKNTRDDAIEYCERKLESLLEIQERNRRNRQQRELQQGSDSQGRVQSREMKPFEPLQRPTLRQTILDLEKAIERLEMLQLP